MSNLTARILVACIGIPIILWITLLGGYFFFLLVTAVSMLMLFEFYTLSEGGGATPLKGLGLAAGFLVSASFEYERIQVDAYPWLLNTIGVRLPMFSQEQLLATVVLIFVLLTLLTELFRPQGSPLRDAGATILGVLVISLCMGTLIGLRELFPYGFPIHRFLHAEFTDEHQLGMLNSWGGYTVIAILASIWMCDTAAYFGGRAFGKHKLLERVSPNKTWEGAFFGFVFSVLTAVAAKALVLSYLSYLHAIALGVLLGIFGQLGDLIESRFKRDAGVKDSSSLIPGHGGVYDRFDSLVYVSPIVYLYMTLVVLS